MTQAQTIEIELSLPEKLQQLRGLLSGLGRTIVAYSGGVDSALLLKLAHEELGDRVQGVLGISPSLMPQEQSDAIALAAEMGVPIRLVETHEMQDPNYTANPTNRCYFCKSTLFDILTELAAREGFDHVCDGTNLDDLQEWRPGAAAGRERGIRSPLLEAGLSKADIREISRSLGLPTWDKPAMPCLSSRIPYGTPVTAAALGMIGRAEAWLRARGIREVRVRHFAEGDVATARIEVAPPELPQLFELRDELTLQLRDIGYSSILLDLEGYRRGKLNDAIGPQPVQLHL